MRLGDYLKLGGKNFRRNGFKTTLPIIIITIGIVLFNIMSGFFTSITNGTKEAITDNKSLCLISVKSKNESESLMPNDFDKMKKTDGVLSSLPNVTSNITVPHHGEERQVTLIGVDNAAIPYYTSGKEIPLKGNELVLSSSLSKDFKVGAKMPISYQVKVREEIINGEAHIEGDTKEKPAKIKAFYEPFHIQNYPDNDPVSLAPVEFVEQLNAELERLTLAQYRQKTNYTGTVLAKGVEDVKGIVEKLDKMGYGPSCALQSAEDVPMVAKMIAIIGGIVVLILLLSSGVSIASIIGNSLRGRYKEIGVLRALGFERGHLIKLFSVEILYIALISFVSSVFVSVLLMRVVEYYVNQQLTNGANPFVLAMDGNKVLLSLLLIILVSLLASARPILRASSVNITEIIRGNAT